MTASGKTLTVTYGAFACTIDGYDDPMPVLRSVVAFFRDLTAEDPAFGTVAMPPAAPAAAPPRPSPLTPEEVASLAAPEPGESRLTASVSTQAARATIFTPEPGESEAEEEEEDLLAATMPRPAPEAGERLAQFRVPPGDPDAAPPLTEPPENTAAPEAFAPRRPAAPPEEADPEGREEEDDAPLVLTPDLRVDRVVELMPHEMVQDEAAEGHAAAVTLSEFLARTGAGTLADRMEAAAAHAIVLEGRESLSRPALLRAMQGVGAEPLGFEDGLKAFGTLLRDGRLRKADYGRYILSERSAYLAEARAML